MSSKMSAKTQLMYEQMEKKVSSSSEVTITVQIWPLFEHTGYM